MMNKTLRYWKIVIWLSNLTPNFKLPLKTLLETLVNILCNVRCGDFGYTAGEEDTESAFEPFFSIGKLREPNSLK